ncbi:MAG: PPC domain-containing protein [Halorientalis sp.]
MKDGEPDSRTLLRAGAAAAASLGIAGCSRLGLGDESTPTSSGQNLRSIAIGETAEGYIDNRDGVDPEYNDLAEPVTFEGQAGQTVVVRMASEAVDPYLVVAGPDGDTVAEDDDGASGTNSELTTTLPESGTYTIWAGSFSGDATGAYTLSVSEASGAPSEEIDLTSISYGETAEGYIDDGDGRDPEYDDLAEPVTFSGNAGDAVTISMRSETVDTFLLLSGPDGTTVAENDDGGSGLNSEITTTLPESGTYTIWAGSYSGDATGPYTLSLEEGTAGGNVDLRRISYGETAQGYIDAGDPRDPSRGGLAEPVTFSGSEGDAVTIEMRSDPVDTYLILTNDSGFEVAQDDDGGSGLNSRLTTTLPESGTYTIWAGSFSSEETGPYTLSLEQTGAVTGGGSDLRSISYGQTARGYIDTGDPRDPSRGSLAEPVTFQGSEGDTVTISMESDPIDTYLILTNDNGVQVAEDDDGGSGFLNSEITTTLPESGTYTIWAGSYGRDETGRYTLSLDQL